MFDNDPQNYYEILDVKPDATQAEIRQAYFRVKSAYGKDSAALYSLFDARETHAVLQRLEEAYLVLSNPGKRKEYDRIHGFLKAEDELPITRKPNSQAHVFSFSQNSVMGSVPDAAKQAAEAMFGKEAVSDLIDDTSTEMASHQKSNSIESSVQPETYSTPRTLESHSAAGPLSEDYSLRPYENRLGIIRRMDLVKQHAIDSAIEDEIAREEQFRGSFLRKIREYRGISIDELSDFTKISRTYINCIELEEFESLPAAVYVRGFIIQIAKALRLPHEKVTSGYMTHYKNTVSK